MLTKNTDYIWMPPVVLARKFLSIQLRAGLTAGFAKRGSAYYYNIPEKRAQERRRVKAAEQEYVNFESRWRTKPRSRESQVQPTQSLSTTSVSVGLRGLLKSSTI